ncbi:MAG: diguanylate cyclase domain-containing protein [Terriglobales bacterium]
MTAVVVMLLLAFAVYSFTIVPQDSKPALSRGVERAAYALFAVLVVFAIFAFQQQVVINRLRRQLAGQLKLAAALRTRAELFQKLAILDPLTGLYNRRFVMQHLPVELSRSERYNYKITALVFDLDGLKQINDRYSHLAGDMALREFATALRRAIRSSDVAMRLGGDEFLVVLPECEAEAIPRVLARLTQLQVSFRGEVIPLSFSAGWAEHTAGETANELLARADQKLYSDKRAGTAGQRVRAYQEQVRQAEKMQVMGRLTTSVAHDFNNLLTVIRGYSELLQQSLPPSDTCHVHAEQIHNAAQRAAALTSQLLAFCRNQSVVPQLLDVNKVVSGMEMMLRRLLGEHIKLNIQVEPELHVIRADPGQVEQIVMNLAANARDALPRGGHVTVETSHFEMDAEFARSHPGARVGQYVRVTVRDDGVGMDDETQSHIFEPFFTTKDPGKGTGLGLSTVYGIAKQNGGYVWVNSKPEEGTCVSVYLPWAVAALSETAARPVPAVAPAQRVAGNGPTTVLVVEAFDELRNMICDFLRSAGYRAVEAVNGEQAIQIAADSEATIDVMICDIMLPGMSGLELSECLVAADRGMRVLYMAGCIEDASLYREWLQGNAYFLPAPFTPEQLLDKVCQLCHDQSAKSPKRG